ncbi:glycosyl transferase, partial [Methylobacterium sp. NEAU K]|nr:glycosyl transferase [Methylobacterium sp. NEAU K]
MRLGFNGIGRPPTLGQFRRRIAKPLARGLVGSARVLRLRWRQLSDPLGKPAALHARWVGADAAAGAVPEARLAAALEPYFDAGFYASWYGIAVDPVRDYLVTGWREGRDPRPDFSTADYLAARPYLAAAGVNPFLHWITAQRAQDGAALPKPDTRQAERLARRLVDGPFYLANNPDLEAAGVDPAAHYMASGWREGREPSPRFDTLAYCLSRGISYATWNPLVHYVLHGGSARPGAEETRALQAETLAPYFDAAYYRRGLDEAQAEALAGTSDAALLRAYVAGGWRALRSPRQDFDPA